MSDTTEKTILSGIDQPLKLELPNLNSAMADAIKKSALYTNAAKVHDLTPAKERIMLESTVTTNGWDTVSICRVTALNERIKSEKSYPADIFEETGTIFLKGSFAPWQIVTGGDGRNVKINIPMKSGEYVGIGETFDVAGISVDVYVKLNYFPIPEPKMAKDGSYELYVSTELKNNSDPIAAVIALHDDQDRMDNINQSVLRGIFEEWLNKPENLKKFDTLFSTILINNMGDQSEEYKWLRATTISYAYTDMGTDESSIFGILCMTNGNSADGLGNQLPAASLKRDDNAVFLISRQVFVKHQLLPAMPFIFPESKDARYILDEAGTTITAKNLILDPVKVGAVNYHPIAEYFEICFDETYIRTTASIFTNISPGIDVTSTITTKQTIGLGENAKGEQVMVYEMVGEPITQSTTHTAPWVIVTEALIELIATVVGFIIGKVVSGKFLAIILGVIIAAVAVAITAAIHIIIEKVIADGITDDLPSIEPMVRVAANQVKWPFCEPDAFVLSDIDYSGAIIFDGVLKLSEKYHIVNNRLALRAIGA